MGTYTGTPNTYTAGQVLTAAQLNAIRDFERAFTDVWTPYTPTWTAFGGTPTIGNGALAGRYVQVGKLVDFRLQLMIGSTTSLGTTTTWEFGLPVASFTSGSPLLGWILDAGTAEIMCGGRLSGGSTFRGLTIAASGLYLGYNTPMAWANGDVLDIGGTYEAA